MVNITHFIFYIYIYIIHIYHMIYNTPLLHILAHMFILLHYIFILFIFIIFVRFTCALKL